jgi:hypothetical protein
MRYSATSPSSILMRFSTTSKPVMPRSVRFARATIDCAASSKETGLDPMIWLTLLIHIQAI